jgi:hypothetical protein
MKPPDHPSNSTGGERSRTTVLDGYYATGDLECFCFDKHEAPWADEHGEPGEFYDYDQCRVYPDDLIPEGIGRVRGRWTVTVTFVPDASSEGGRDLAREFGADDHAR